MIRAERDLTAAAPRQWFYGWVVVAAVFVVTFVGYGIAYSFAAFFPSLGREFAALRGELSLVFSLSGFLYFGLGVVSGPLADRLGPRRVVTLGMVLIAAGLYLAAEAQSLRQVYIRYGLGVGLGVGFAYVPAVGAVQRWFVARRGLATGLAVAGIGAGTLAMPALAGALIQASDWRTAYRILAVVALVAGGAAALFIEHSPERRGQWPDGVRPENGGTSIRPAVEGPSVADALRSRPFWIVYVASLLSSVGIYIPFVHLPAYARDHGVSEYTSLILLGLIGIGSLVGRFGMAGLADRYGRRTSLSVMYAGMAVMLVWWAGSTATWSMAVFAFAFGLGYGGYVALFPAMSADYFAGASSSGIFGWMVTNLAFGTLLGPALAGLAFDLARSYTLPILATAFLNVIAALAMLLAPDPADWRRAWFAARRRPVTMGRARAVPRVRAAEGRR